MKVVWALISVMSLSACAMTEQNQPAEQQPLVNIFKDAERKQCFSDGISLAVMNEELVNNGIAVKCSARDNDGLMYAQACGKDEGTINVFKIAQGDLAKAEKLGYQLTSAIKSKKIVLNCQK